jgi:hypothetical protein
VVTVRVTHGLTVRPSYERLRESAPASAREPGELARLGSMVQRACGTGSARLGLSSRATTSRAEPSRGKLELAREPRAIFPALLTITIIVITKIIILITTCKPYISDQVSLINGAPLAAHNRKHD